MDQDKTKICFIMMSCGYVESNMTSWLIYQCRFFGNDGFDTPKQAVTELALDMYAKFQDDVMAYRKPKNKCCKSASVLGAETSDPEMKLKYRFCPQCGSELTEHRFDPAEFRYYIVGLHNTTCDSYGDAEDTSTRTLAWWPWWTHEFVGAKKEEVVFIGKNAEHVLLAALYEAMPDLLKQVQEEDEYEGYANSDWDRIKEGKYEAE